SDVGVAARVVEGEVIEDHGVEMARGHLYGALRRRDILRILVIEGAERTALVRGRERDAAVDADAVRPKEAHDPPERGRIGEYAAAVLLEIHLVEMNLTPDPLELLLQRLRVGELAGRGHRDVDRDTEVFVGTLLRGGDGHVAREHHARRGDRAADPCGRKLPHHGLPAPPAHAAQWTCTRAPEYWTVLSAGAVKSSPGRPWGDIQRIRNARLCCIP